MKLKCLVVDDEPSGRKVMEELIDEAGFLEMAGTASNPVKAMSAIHSGTIDLLFLDIQMPKINGIDFLRSLRHPPMVILTTAFSEYALQGFELDVIDYLLKPVSLERFLKACNKARDFYELKQNHGKTAEAPLYFFIKCNNRYERILFDDLIYAEAADNYVILHTRARRFVTYLTFKGLAEQLPASRFIKVHKSFIVALDKIDSLDGEEIKAGSHIIPISRTQKELVLSTVLSRKVLKR